MTVVEIPTNQQEDEMTIQQAETRLHELIENDDLNDEFQQLTDSLADYYQNKELDDYLSQFEDPELDCENMVVLRDEIEKDEKEQQLIRYNKMKQHADEFYNRWHDQHEKDQDMLRKSGQFYFT